LVGSRQGNLTLLSWHWFRNLQVPLPGRAESVYEDDTSVNMLTVKQGKNDSQNCRQKKGAYFLSDVCLDLPLITLVNWLIRNIFQLVLYDAVNRNKVSIR
jgi:hypothetical protein